MLNGNGAGTFGAASLYSAGTIPNSIAVGDYNEDGRPDIAAADYVAPGTVSVLINEP